MNKNETKKISYIWIPFFESLSSGEKEISYIIFGLALIILPILLYLYAEKVFLKLVEFGHLLIIKKVCKEPSINLSSEAGKTAGSGTSVNQSGDIGNTFKGTPGNFIFLVYSVDSQLKLLEKEIRRGRGGVIKEDGKKDDAGRIMRNEVLTRAGRKKIKFIYWVKGIVERGQAEDLSVKTLEAGICMSWQLHREINEYLCRFV